MAIPLPLILEAMKMIPKLRKSKTAGANIGVGAVVALLTQFGINLEPELVSAIFVIANIILRMLTKKSLIDK